MTRGAGPTLCDGLHRLEKTGSQRNVSPLVETVLVSLTLCGSSSKKAACPSQVDLMRCASAGVPQVGLTCLMAAASASDSF